MSETGAGVPMLSGAVNGSSGGGGAGSGKRASSAKGSGQRTVLDDVRSRSGGMKSQWRQRKSLLLFDRASSRWWNPQFASSLLESQYWKCSFPQLRDRFRSGLIFIVLKSLGWFVYHAVKSDWNLTFPYQIAALLIVLLSLAIFGFTFSAQLYQRFYLPTSFLCTFLVCVLSLLLFSLQSQPVIGPVGMFTTSVEVVLLLYTVIPLPLYLCILAGAAYSVLYEVLSHQVGVGDVPGTKLVLHGAIHILGIHIFILSQVRQRKTFIKVGQSLLARKEIEIETQFKDHMIQSVMPRKVADVLLKETTEMRRPSMAQDSKRRLRGGKGEEGEGGMESGPPGSGPAQGRGSAAGPGVFRPFTMSLMNNVSILFADIAGFTKMSTGLTADELVFLLNDLFGRFDTLCGLSGCEKISTLGDCYYCVAGCPEPKPDHAKCCVEMGLGMIRAIREFDEDRQQEVNMRVGIHTGTVMCGMVGTKRFKFDVFSNDVTLANTMESSGKAGRVHISESTKAFLGDAYTYEDDALVEGLQTFFITGRKDEPPLSELDTIPLRIPFPAETREAESGDASLPATTATMRTEKGAQSHFLFHFAKGRSQPSLGKHSSGSSGAGGSLRMKLLGTSSAHKTSASASQPLGSPADPTKKSASLQALSGSVTAGGGVSPGPEGAGVLHSSGSTHTAGSDPKSVAATPAARDGRAQTMSSWGTAATASLNKDLANGDSGSNRSMGSAGEHRGSRSSGLAELSEAHSRALMDSVITAAHATSFTRFETDHRDFDRRLADCIQSSNLARSGYMIHGPAVNPWTLGFSSDEVEAAYQLHFVNPGALPAAAGAASQHSSPSKSDASSSGALEAPSYSVLVDIAVAFLIFLIVSILVFCIYTPPQLSWMIYFALTLPTFLVVGIVSSWGMLSGRTLNRCLTSRLPRHALALFLLALPLGAALTNIWDCSKSTSEIIPLQLMAAYITFTILFAHANFSQISSWPKTIQAAAIGVILAVLAQCCICPTRGCSPSAPRLQASVNGTPFLPLPTPPTDSTSGVPTKLFLVPIFSASPAYRYEILLDLLLALLLIGALNYQFEWNFRMSFFGDYQARMDTQKMKNMRDQADWLLSNIIPAHVVEELKVNSKYSEGAKEVAVVFASIVNWHEMYEETFEGGKEFLRVLNEVIGDFDELLDQPDFSTVEKIKTIGSTYMAASGLNREKTSTSNREHLYQLMDFSLALQETLENFNADLLNFEFRMKIGFNIGPIVAGVIGTTKLYYDIWGDTVNIASRMYSTGKEGRIQVPAKVAHALGDRYVFQFRDHVDVSLIIPASCGKQPLRERALKVKGIDGGMDVYLLTGRRNALDPSRGLPPPRHSADSRSGQTDS